MIDDSMRQRNLGQVKARVEAKSPTLCRSRERGKPQSMIMASSGTGEQASRNQSASKLAHSKTA